MDLPSGRKAPEGRGICAPSAWVSWDRLAAAPCVFEAVEVGDDHVATSGLAKAEYDRVSCPDAVGMVVDTPWTVSSERLA